MSAPDTNLKKQARRHRPSMVGIALALISALVVAVAFAAWDGPEDDAARGLPAATSSETQ